MIRARTRAVTALGAFITLSAFLACDGADTPVDSTPELPGLTITPASGTPGSIVLVESPVLEEPAGTAGALSVDIGGLTAPARISPAGEFLAAVPILVAGESGDALPDGPVTVELFEGEEVVARAELAFTVTPLEPSPGALDTLGAALMDLAGSVSEAAAGLGDEVSVTSAYAQSVMAGLEDLLTGEDERSLASHLERLESEDPEAKALLESALAATGVIEATRQFADALEAASAPAAAPGGALEHSGTSSVIADQLTDVDLAAKMQFYTMAKLFGETVVNETASDYAATVGLGTGVLAMFGSIPAAAGIGALLSVADFAVNKVYLGLFPAELSSFEIVLEDDQLRLGETTAARLELEARNDPPTLSLQEFINLAVELAGLNATRVRAKLTQSPVDVLEAFYNFLIGTIHGQLSAYQTEHPELGLDPTISEIPSMTWTTVGHDVRLFEVRTFHPDIVTPAEGELDWLASGPDLGEARVTVQTATGPESILIDGILGVEYAGGAFGEDVIGTETISIFVTSDLVLEVDFTSTIENDEIAALEARAGHLNEEGEPVWEPGIEISLIVDGGTVAETSGMTDSDGQFITLAQLTPESESIIITVTAADALGQELDRTVEAAATQLAFDFDDGPQGWRTGGLGSVNNAVWVDWADESMQMDGVDGAEGDSAPNSWIYHTLDIPSDATDLNFDATGHNKPESDGNLRVRIEEDGSSTVVMDWRRISGVDGSLNWQPQTVDISAFAGRTITLYFEQDDTGEGVHEQVYIDNVVIQ